MQQKKKSLEDDVCVKCLFKIDSMFTPVCVYGDRYRFSLRITLIESEKMVSVCLREAGEWERSRE